MFKVLLPEWFLVSLCQSETTHEIMQKVSRYVYNRNMRVREMSRQLSEIYSMFGDSPTAEEVFISVKNYRDGENDIYILRDGKHERFVVNTSENFLFEYDSRENTLQEVCGKFDTVNIYDVSEGTRL